MHARHSALPSAQEAAGSLGDAADLREELEKAKEKAKAAEEARDELSKEMDSHRQRHESLLQVSSPHLPTSPHICTLS